MKRIIILACLYICVYIVAQAADIVQISGDTEYYHLEEQVMVLEDPDHVYNLRDIENEFRKNQFKKKWQDGSKMNFGFTNSIYWFRVRVTKTIESEKQFFFMIDYPLLDSIEYTIIPDEGALIDTIKLGDSNPYDLRLVNFRTFIIPFSLETSATIYLKVKTTSTFSVPLSILRPIALAQKMSFDRGYYFSYFSVMGVMFLYNLFLFLKIRDRSYFFYILFILIYSGTQASLSGIGYEHIWPNNVWFQKFSIPVFMSLSWLPAILFTQAFLHTKKFLPRMHKFFNLMWPLTLIIFSLTFLIGPIIGTKMGIFFSIIATTSIFSAGVLTLKNYYPARYFIAAWSFMLFGIALRAFQGAGLLELTFLTQHALEIGSCIEVILLSLALGDRISLMKKEKEDALILQLAEAKKNAALKRTFEKFVPVQYLKRISLEGMENVILGASEEAFLTILFSDIRDFTPLSETMHPDEVLRFLNAYLKRMNPAIHDNSGFIDKFIGDAIMALFDRSNGEKIHHAHDALNSSIILQEILNLYNEHREKSKYRPINFGVGIHTGNVVIGTVGSENRMDSTTLGDVVNFTARLERLTKEYQTQVLVSGTTVETLSTGHRYVFRDLGFVQVKGKRKFERIYELVDALPEERRRDVMNILSLFHDGMSFFLDNKHGSAFEFFSQCQKLVPSDHVTSIFLKRCAEQKNNPQTT